MRNPVADIAAAELLSSIQDGGNMARIGLIEPKQGDGIVPLQAPQFQQFQDELNRSRQSFCRCPGLLTRPCGRG